jgi:hypothetical protein
MESRRVIYKLLIFINISEGMQEAIKLQGLITGAGQPFLPVDFFWNVLSSISRQTVFYITLGFSWFCLFTLRVSVGKIWLVG